MRWSILVLVLVLVAPAGPVRADSSFAIGGHVDDVPSRSDHPFAAGASLEIEHWISNRAALRATLVVDDFHMTSDECEFEWKGTVGYGLLGMRFDFLPHGGSPHAGPFAGFGVGAALAHGSDTCPSPAAMQRVKSSGVSFEAELGVDVPLGGANTSLRVEGAVLTNTMFPDESDALVASASLALSM